MKQILISLSGRHLLTSVKMKSQINLFTEKLSRVVLFLRSRQSSSLKPPRALLQQIASLLCKFVQAISWASLGAPVWQQEWLKSWLPSLLPLGTGMTVASQLSLRLRAIVTSPIFLQPLFCSCPRLPPVSSFGFIVTRFDCSRQKVKRLVVSDRGPETASVPSVIAGYVRLHHRSEKNALICEMKYAERDEGSDVMACDVGRAHIPSYPRTGLTLPGFFSYAEK